MDFSCYNYQMNKNESTFGDNLREIRKEKGYTQAELSKRTGISRRVIGHYETVAKSPSLDKIKKLAETLNVPIDSLIGETKSKNKKEDVPYKILKKVRVIEKLPTRDQNAIFQFINTIAEKNKLKEEIKQSKKEESKSMK